MRLTLLKSKLHRATVTGADIDYEGSIAIDPKLCEIAKFHKLEKVEIYNVSNGERFSTYVIHGKPGEICLNGAAARLVHKGDKVIICTYCEVEGSEAIHHEARVVLVNDDNTVKSMYDQSVK